MLNTCEDPHFLQKNPTPFGNAFFPIKSIPTICCVQYRTLLKPTSNTHSHAFNYICEKHICLHIHSRHYYSPKSPSFMISPSFSFHLSKVLERNPTKSNKSEKMGPNAVLTGVLLSEKVFMLMDLLILSEERDGGEGLRLSSCSWCGRSWRWRYSRHARWMLPQTPRHRVGAECSSKNDLKYIFLSEEVGCGGFLFFFFFFCAFCFPIWIMFTYNYAH